MNESAYPMDLKCTDDDYNDALLKLDVVTCEAMAVSQAIREEAPICTWGFPLKYLKGYAPTQWQLSAHCLDPDG